jgi:GTPase SAR1 family protein
MIKEYDYLFKIVIIGTSSVGKSSILRRFSDDCFQESYPATIGVDFRFKYIKINTGQLK